jgi:hypothetical protein
MTNDLSARITGYVLPCFVDVNKPIIAEPHMVTTLGKDGG